MTQTLHDQADELRQLVLRTALRDRAAETPAPPLVVLAGGKGGVGATTTAVNLAVSLARQGQRIVLIDADFGQPDATAMCHLSESDTVADVLSGRRTVHEVLQRGPAGIQVLPGVWGGRTLPQCSPMAQQRLLTELARLGPHADVVLLDAGSSSTALANRFWQAADLALFVTTNEPTAIMDCYAAIKVLSSSDYRGLIRTLVNKSSSEQEAVEVAGRISQACQRFLGFALEHLPSVPLDTAVTEAVYGQRPVALQTPHSAAAQAIESLASDVQHLIQLIRARRRTAAA